MQYYKDKMFFNEMGSKGKPDQVFLSSLLKTTMGEIVDARNVEASSSSVGLSLGGGVGMFHGNLIKYVWK